MILSIAVLSACSSDSIEELQNEANPPEEEEEMPDEATIWTGEPMEFTKENFADPALEENQDRITDNVWITRGEDNSIYNAVSQSGGAPNPDDTQWAFGTTDDIDNLTFDTFQTTHGMKAKQLPGKEMVLYLVTDNIYIDLMFTSWTARDQGGGGGFTYTRSTP